MTSPEDKESPVQASSVQANSVQANSVQAHRRAGPSSQTVYVITSSDTRDEASDTSGRLIQDMLVEAGHRVAGYRIVKDDSGAIHEALEAALADPDVEVVLVNGGTGIAHRDRTFEEVQRLLDKPIPGFGELFRYLSYEDIGSAAMLSRATAGVARGTILISMPGSSGAVRLALEKLILPEIGHMVGLLRS